MTNTIKQSVFTKQNTFSNMSYMDKQAYETEKKINNIILKLNEQYDLKISDSHNVIQKYNLMQTRRIYRGETRIYMFYMNVFCALDRPIPIKDYCLCFGLHIGLFNTMLRTNIQQYPSKNIFDTKDICSLFGLSYKQINSDVEDDDTENFSITIEI